MPITTPDEYLSQLLETPLVRGRSCDSNAVEQALSEFDTVVDRISWLVGGDYGAEYQAAIYWQVPIKGNIPKYVLTLLLNVEWDLNKTGCQKFFKELMPEEIDIIFAEVKELIEEYPHPNNVSLSQLHKETRKVLEYTPSRWFL